MPKDKNTGNNLNKPESVSIPVDTVVMCKTPSIPTAKNRKVHFSTIKRRAGKESVPFLGLDAGIHRVKFYNDKQEVVLTVKTWLSPYGWAWQILGT